MSMLSMLIDTGMCLPIGDGVMMSIDVDLGSLVDDKLSLLGSLSGFSDFLFF